MVDNKPKQDEVFNEGAIISIDKYSPRLIMSWIIWVLIRSGEIGNMVSLSRLSVPQSLFLELLQLDLKTSPLLLAAFSNSRRKKSYKNSESICILALGHISRLRSRRRRQLWGQRTKDRKDAEPFRRTRRTWWIWQAWSTGPSSRRKTRRSYRSRWWIISTNQYAIKSAASRWSETRIRLIFSASMEVAWERTWHWYSFSNSRSSSSATCARCLTWWAVLVLVDLLQQPWAYPPSSIRTSQNTWRMNWWTSSTRSKSKSSSSTLAWPPCTQAWIISTDRLVTSRDSSTMETDFRIA